MYYINPKRISPFGRGICIFVVMIHLTSAILFLTNFTPRILPITLYGIGLMGTFVAVFIMITQGREWRP